MYARLTAVGRFGGGRLPAVRQPVTQGFGRWLWIMGEALQHIVQVGEGVDPMAVTRRGHAEQDRRRLGTGLAARE